MNPSALPHLLGISCTPLRDINTAPPEFQTREKKLSYILKLCNDLIMLPGGFIYLNLIPETEPYYQEYIDTVAHPMAFNPLRASLRNPKSEISVEEALKNLALIFTNSYLFNYTSDFAYVAAHYMQYRSVMRLVNSGLFTEAEIKLVASSANWKGTPQAEPQSSLKTETVQQTGDEPSAQDDPSEDEEESEESSLPEQVPIIPYEWPEEPNLDEILERSEGDDVPLSWDEREEVMDLFAKTKASYHPLCVAFLQLTSSHLSIPSTQLGHGRHFDVDDLPVVIQRALLTFLRKATI
ncbi:hypothetical protein BLNAU_8786 [Blattamonas nauphoetae]|uniref:Bromo domain-containing protein n=1 Tax=Blattamonas nauphoetae TaxID=2049346 RepID=A0ABQ9XXI8_9EUKA|nr:hypothetical protein BLNAU_8786 [Blattamonas nauphoetae]